MNMARDPADKRVERVSPRIAVAAPTTMKWGAEKLFGYVETVNLAGLYVAADRLPELGEYVDMIFSLPGNPKSFRVRASVVHTDPIGSDRRPGFGARFERPPLGFLEAIQDLGKGH
jgi:Tfp pilus assembly protein PilZ